MFVKKFMSLLSSCPVKQNHGGLGDSKTGWQTCILDPVWGAAAGGISSLELLKLPLRVSHFSWFEVWTV